MATGTKVLGAAHPRSSERRRRTQSKVLLMRRLMIRAVRLCSSYLQPQRTAIRSQTPRSFSIPRSQRQSRPHIHPILLPHLCDGALVRHVHVPLLGAKTQPARLTPCRRTAQYSRRGTRTRWKSRRLSTSSTRTMPCFKTRRIASPQAVHSRQNQARRHPCQTRLLGPRRRSYLRRPIARPRARPRTSILNRTGPTGTRVAAEVQHCGGCWRADRDHDGGRQSARCALYWKELGHMQTTYGDADRGRDGVTTRRGRAAGSFAVRISPGLRLVWRIWWVAHARACERVR